MNEIKSVKKTENLVNKCECGEIVTMERYAKVSEDGSLKDDRYFAFCPCGILFYIEYAGS